MQHRRLRLELGLARKGTESRIDLDRKGEHNDASIATKRDGESRRSWPWRQGDAGSDASEQRGKNKHASKWVGQFGRTNDLAQYSQSGPTRRARVIFVISLISLT
jgi:hypothetical protein